MTRHGKVPKGVVHLWTHNNLGTPYDRVSTTDDGPAPWTITRDLTINPLPESCGAPDHNQSH